MAPVHVCIFADRERVRTGISSQPQAMPAALIKKFD